MNSKSNTRLDPSAPIQIQNKSCKLLGEGEKKKHNVLRAWVKTH